MIATRHAGAARARGGGGRRQEEQGTARREEGSLDPVRDPRRRERSRSLMTGGRRKGILGVRTKTVSVRPERRTVQFSAEFSFQARRSTARRLRCLGISRASGSAIISAADVVGSNSVQLRRCSTQHQLQRRSYRRQVDSGTGSATAVPADRRIRYSDSVVASVAYHTVRDLIWYAVYVYT